MQQTVMRVMTGVFTSDEGDKLRALRAKMARDVIGGLFQDHDVLITPARFCRPLPRAMWAPIPKPPH